MNLSRLLFPSWTKGIVRMEKEKRRAPSSIMERHYIKMWWRIELPQSERPNWPGYLKNKELKTAEEEREREGRGERREGKFNQMHTWDGVTVEIRKAKQMSDCESMASGHAVLLSVATELTSSVSTDSKCLRYQYALEPRGTQTPSFTTRH